MDCGSAWIDSLAMYMKEVAACSLDLRNKLLERENFASLLRYLPGSQVKELILAGNNLSNKMKALSQVLVRTEVQKLNISKCSLTKGDLLELMEMLKDTKITELDVTDNVTVVDDSSDSDSISDSESDDDDTGHFTEEEQKQFLSLMRESNLEIFHFNLVDFFDARARDTVCEGIVSTKIFELNVQCIYDSRELSPLFSSLHHSSLTDLKIKDAKYEKRSMKILSQALKNSKLRKLHLTNCNIPDTGVDILAEGLVHSEITELNLSGNQIRGANTLGLHLKDTQIKILTLDANSLDEEGIFLSPQLLKLSQVATLGLKHCRLGNACFRKLMKSLKFSKVAELDLSFTGLEKAAICKLAKILSKTDLKRLSLAGNKLSQETAVALAEGIRGSNLQHIDLASCFGYPTGGILVPLFLCEARGSAVESLTFRCNGLNEAGAKTLAVHLEKTTFSRLDLSENWIKIGASYLSNHLKLTALSYLNLSSCKVSDEGVATLAACLQESQLVELLLDSNKITCQGAEALALSLKVSKLLCLSLARNKIENNGLIALAKGAENTFITQLAVTDNPSVDSHNMLMIDAVLYRNKVSVNRLRNAFKKIAPQTGDSEFRFTQSGSQLNASEFLDECLELYKNIIQEPAAIEALVKDKNILLSKKEIIASMSHDFPKQFAFFIAVEIDAKPDVHVTFVKKAEGFGLKNIVEFLLLNRPLYIINKEKEILHPYIYKLLNKYNYPLCNTDVEPDGEKKIINYFKNSNIEGASDVIRLLRGKRKL